jgi:hypothetical protein
MSEPKKPTPNTYLGEVHWYVDMYWGNLLWVCQMMLGLDDPKHKSEDFLDTKTQDVSDLRDFFNEIDLPNGMIGFELFADDMYHTTTLCEIETTIPADEDVSDQIFLNLIEDFKEYVSKLPIAKSGEGALITDPSNPGYYEESNQRWLESVRELNEALGLAFKAAKDQLQSEGITIVHSSGSTDEDDIPF